jgi:hypothetical protein
MHGESECDADRLEDTARIDDGVSLDNEPANERRSTMVTQSHQHHADNAESNNDDRHCSWSTNHRRSNGVVVSSSLRSNDHVGAMESPHGRSPCSDDEPPPIMMMRSEAERSLTLMQRIGTIKKRLSQSHHSLNSLNIAAQRGSEQLRSKSMPPMVSQQLEEEIMTEDEPSLASTVTTGFDRTPMKTSSRISSRTGVASTTMTPKNESTVSTTPFGRSSLSFQSLSTMDSDVDTKRTVSNKKHQRGVLDDSYTEPVNVSRTSQRSTMTPIREQRVRQTPSPTRGPKAATDTEQSDFVVDNQRANVVEKLRGAAFKRRMDVSRSRDSLIAKEQLHREQNLFVKVVPPPTRTDKDIADGREQDDSKNKKEASNSNEKPLNQFRALPLPKTTGLFEGSYGLAGVPNIKKKDPTVANSPCLGRRRQQQRSLASRETGTDNRPRLLPPTYKEGGSIGLPRIVKKPVTVPNSPMLGPRRAQSARPVSSRRPPIVPLFRRKSFESHSSGSSGSLLGLALCNKENPAPPLIQTPTSKKKTVQPFVPHSTKRAAQRSAYDARRVEYEHQLREQQHRDRKMLIKTLERDIEKIRKKL